MSNLTNFKTRFVSYLVVLLFLVLLTACGGGGDGPGDPDPNGGGNTKNPPPPPATKINRQLSGTVAVGAPVAGTITIIDAKGNTLSVESDANGTYSVNLGGQLGPYLIRVEPNDSSLPVMYSYATGSGVANITPFTMLALYLAYRTDLQTAFDNWASNSTWKRADLEQALAKVNANFETGLLNAGVDPKVYDFFTEPFNADQTGIDAFLENYNVSIDFNNNSYEITDSSSQPVVFNENIDTAGYYIGAWFVPEGTAQWQFTYTYNINGTESTITYPVLYSSDDIPWNKDRFNETFWKNLADNESQTYTCEDSPNVQCNIVWEVTRLESNYEVIGNGEVGTIVQADASYSWSMTGYIQYTGQPRQDINYSYSWTFSWSWERVS